MRKEYTRKQRGEIFLRAGGKCEKCEAFLKVGEGEIDHILPIELGGETILDNAQLLCRVCHRGKTTIDIRKIRKSDRQRDKHTGAVKKKGFGGLWSKFKRRLDGKVVDRKTGEEV